VWAIGIAVFLEHDIYIYIYIYNGIKQKRKYRLVFIMQGLCASASEIPSAGTEAVVRPIDS
jgi:hypothetical protein